MSAVTADPEQQLSSSSDVQGNGEEGAMTVTVNVDVEESTVDDREGDRELVENDDMSEGEFGVAGVTSPQEPSQNGHSPPKPLVSARLLQTTHARINSAKALEEGRGRVKHEDDIWWDQRGSKAYNIPRGNVNKALAHVTSKLHVPTAATVFGQREKADLTKIRPKPLPKPANPEAINPHKDVQSKVFTATTKAIQSGEWKTFKERQKEEEAKAAEDAARQHAEAKKVTQTSDKLLQAPDYKRVAKPVKVVDKREEGWKRITIADQAWQPLPGGTNSPSASARLSLGGGAHSRSSPDLNASMTSPTKSLSGTKSVASMASAGKGSGVPPSFEVWSQQMPAYKMYVPPPRPKSPTPCAFGSGSARATTPTEATSRGRSNTPNHGRSLTRSNSVGSTMSSLSASVSGANDNRNRRNRSNSPNRTAPGASNNSNANNGMSRAAEARQRAAATSAAAAGAVNTSTSSSTPGGPGQGLAKAMIDRASPPLTPFDKIMQHHGMHQPPSAGGASNSSSSSSSAAAKIQATPNSNSNNLSTAATSAATPRVDENNNSSNNNNSNSNSNNNAKTLEEEEALHEMY